MSCHLMSRLQGHLRKHIISQDSSWITESVSLCSNILVTKMKRAIEGRMLVVIMLLAVALAAQLQGVWGQTTGTDIEIGEGSNTCKGT